MAKSWNGLRPTPNTNAHRGKSNSGAITWIVAARTATRKRCSSSPSPSPNSLRPAKTLRPGPTCSNLTTSSVSAAKPECLCYETESGGHIPQPDPYDLSREVVDGSRAQCPLHSRAVPSLDRVPDLQHANRVAPA